MERTASIALILLWGALLIPAMIYINHEVIEGLYVWQVYFFIVTPLLVAVPSVDLVFWGCEKTSVSYHHAPVISLFGAPVVGALVVMGSVWAMIDAGVIV